jgi:hypothetical protein
LGGGQIIRIKEEKMALRDKKNYKINEKLNNIRRADENQHKKSLQKFIFVRS